MANPEREIRVDENSGLFSLFAGNAAKAGLIPKKETGSYDGNSLIKWYAAFQAALTEAARIEHWPVTFRVSR